MHAPAPRINAEAWLIFLLVAYEQFYRNFVHRIDGGADAEARVFGKIGTNKSYQWLLDVACPGPADRPHPARINFKKNPNPDFSIEVLIDEDGDRIQVVRGGTRWLYKFDKEYWPRWHHARRCIGDIRSHGKVDCEPDFTHQQAAGLGLERAICRALDFAPRGPILRLERVGQAILPASPEHRALVLLRDWSGIPLPVLRTPARYFYSNIVWVHPKLKPPFSFAHRITLNEVLSRQALAESKKRRAPPKRRPTAYLDLQQEAELFAELLAALAAMRSLWWPQTLVAVQLFIDTLEWLIRARNKIIEAHIWLVKRVARKHRCTPKVAALGGDFDDLVQQGTDGLFDALGAFDPASGYRFQTFAWRQIDWSIRDYVRELRRQARHESTDEITENGNEWMLGMYARKSRDPDKTPDLGQGIK